MDCPSIGWFGKIWGQSSERSSRSIYLSAAMILPLLESLIQRETFSSILRIIAYSWFFFFVVLLSSKSIDRVVRREGNNRVSFRGVVRINRNIIYRYGCVKNLPHHATNYINPLHLFPDFVFSLYLLHFISFGR